MLYKEEETYRKLQEDFFTTHIPWLHRWIMKSFPGTKFLFKYSLAANKEDRNKLTLLRGDDSNMKVVARNFNPE